jgi:hypothetical protein
MLWGYAMPEAGQEDWKRIWRNRDEVEADQPSSVLPELAGPEKGAEEEAAKNAEVEEAKEAADILPERVQERTKGRKAIYSDLSIALTVVSICVAFAISIVSSKPSECTLNTDTFHSDRIYGFSTGEVRKVYRSCRVLIEPRWPGVEVLGCGE